MHFRDLCKTIFHKLSRFSRSKPGKVDKKQKNIEKTAKFCENVGSNCSIRSLTKVLGKNFQSPKMMEKDLKTNTFPERSPVKVDCSVESHSKSLFSKSNEKLTFIREGRKKNSSRNFVFTVLFCTRKKAVFLTTLLPSFAKTKIFPLKVSKFKKELKRSRKIHKIFLPWI